MIGPVVDTGWLERHRGEVAVADVRWYLDGRSGRTAYDAAHIPGALFVDLDTELAAPATAAGGRHPLPDPDAFAAVMSALGIGDDDTVVAYDDAGGLIAARLVWMLRVTGRPAAILDGGIGAWRGPLETEPAQRPPVRFSARPWRPSGSRRSTTPPPSTQPTQS
jgi:thiosulfate/3-mercaptopyruvate sulfurtransferase